MPYSDLPPLAFWRLCREDPNFRAQDLYAPKFELRPQMRVATAGSCFAQNVVPFVRASDLEFVDVEPAPAHMPPEVQMRFGYGLFSARFSNIYTARQLRQLVEDVASENLRNEGVWAKSYRYFDALRPNVEPVGLGSPHEVLDHRRDHLRRVRLMFETADVFFFTLGLTETWEHRKTGLVFPTAPGVVAGQFDPETYAFRNLTVSDCIDDLNRALELIRGIAPKLKVILTVSPVPLTATASGNHVLAATTYSKSVLRAAAGDVTNNTPNVDYFPSFELITGAPYYSSFYANNLRSVTRAGVDHVMAVFFGAHKLGAGTNPNQVTKMEAPVLDTDADAEICEEAMLEAFAKS